MGDSRVDSTVNFTLQKLKIYLQIYICGLQHLKLNTIANSTLQKIRTHFSNIHMGISTS